MSTGSSFTSKSSLGKPFLIPHSTFKSRLSLGFCSESRHDVSGPGAAAPNRRWPAVSLIDQSVSQSVGRLAGPPEASHQTRSSSSSSGKRRLRTVLLLDSVLVKQAESSREVPAQREGEDVDEDERSEGVEQHHRVGQEGKSCQNKRRTNVNVSPRGVERNQQIRVQRSKVS